MPKHLGALPEWRHHKDQLRRVYLRVILYNFTPTTRLLCATLSVLLTAVIKTIKKKNKLSLQSCQCF